MVISLGIYEKIIKTKNFNLTGTGMCRIENVF